MPPQGAPIGVAPWHVERPRLRVAADRPTTVVEAGSGYGKTTFARELAAATGRTLVEITFAPDAAGTLGATRRIAAGVRASPIDTALRLSDATDDDPVELVIATLAAAAPHPALLLVVDDVHHLDDAAATAVARIVGGVRSPHRTVVCGRRIPAPLLDLVGGLPHLTGSDLALRPDEMAAVLRRGWELTLQPGAEAALGAACAGWPAAVVLAAPRLAAADAARTTTVAGRSGAVAHLLADLLADLDDADLAALAQCARLPLLGPALDRPLGRPGLFARTRAAGLPYLPLLEPWWALPDVVREHLGVYAPLDPERLAAVAQVYLRRDHADHAVGALLDAGEAARAADLLAGLPASRVDGVDLADLLTLVERLAPPELDRRPEILVHVARACIPSVAIPRRSDALARATAAAGTGNPLAREVDAEVALDLVRDGRTDEAAAIAERLLAECSPRETLTRARAFDVLGRALAFHSSTDAELQAAGDHLRTASVLAAAADVPGIAAEILLALGNLVERSLGRLDAALEAMNAALARVPGRPRRRAAIHTFRADVLHDLGRDEEAAVALAEAAALARLLGDDRLTAYAAWEAAKGAARRGERTRTLELIDEVHRHRGPWFDHPTGMVFLADAAECCERVGEPVMAESYLARAQERMRVLLGEDDVSVWMARAGCAARSGDPAEALAALDVVDRLSGLAPKDRWRPLALRAHALSRRGDRAEAGAIARAAFDAALACGTPRLPDVAEPAISASLRALAAEASAEHTPMARIDVLGGFRVRSAGEVDLEVPAGLPAQLLKLLAVHAGRVHQDVVSDQLWPTGDLAGAGQRLRNVLHRLRALGLVQRDGESLVLVDVRIDLTEFTTLAARALAAGPTSGAGAARLAVALHRGPLLADDPYLEWAIAPRERVRRTHLDLLDLLAGDALRRGRPDEAAACLERALLADPDDERRAVTLARLHAEAGRAAEARQVLRRAEAVLAELGVDPSADHRALVESLDRS